MTSRVVNYIVMLGPPGAGKGTQAKLMAKELGLKHVASGDMFRRHINQGTELGKKAKAYTSLGLLVPDELTIVMALEEVLGVDAGEGVILDGFPRNLNQAEKVDEALRGRGIYIDAAVLVTAPREELVRRMEGRRVCRECQTPYHVNSSPPKAPGRCDLCGGELYQREDDRPEPVHKRLEVYELETSALRNYYQQQGKLREVVGTGSVEEVNRRLLDTLNNSGVERTAAA